MAIRRAEARALILVCPAAVEPRTDQALSMDCCRCPYANDAVLGTQQQQRSRATGSMAGRAIQAGPVRIAALIFSGRSRGGSSRPSRYARRGADRKSSTASYCRRACVASKRACCSDSSSWRSAAVVVPDCASIALSAASMPSGFRTRRISLLIAATAAHPRAEYGSFHDPVGPKPAITLSRKDWHSHANRAVV
jgi:hypothetical protein